MKPGQGSPPAPERPGDDGGEHAHDEHRANTEDRDISQPGGD